MFGRTNQLLTTASSMAVGWSSQLGSPLYIDIEYYLVMYKLRGMGEGKGQYMAFQQGPVWVKESGQSGTSG